MELSDLAKAFARFRGVLELLDERTLPQALTGLWRLTWPLRKEENARLIAEIELCKSALNLALIIQQ